MLLYDLRQRTHILKDDNVFAGQRGAVSSMCVGKDAFGLTVGTLGGYVATYDIRYGVTAALFKHHLNWPVLAMACYRKNDLLLQYNAKSGRTSTRDVPDEHGNRVNQRTLQD